MRNLIKHILLLLNIVVLFAIVLIKLGSVINPNTFILTSYVSLFLVPIISLNIFFIIFWILARKWYFLLSLLTIILLYPILNSGFAVNSYDKENQIQGKKITLLSYNTMSVQTKKKHTARNPNQVVKYILDSNADILCLQEFGYSLNEKYFTEKDMYNIFQKYPYKHIQVKQNKWNIGIVTFSKFPIINKQTVDYPIKYNLSIYSDVVIYGDTLRIVNNHLESNRVTSKDIDQTSKLKDNPDSKALVDLTKYLSKKMSVAYKKRGEQAVAVSELIQKSPYKVICCGDFNDVPSSYVYTKVKGELKDSFQELGFGLGFTFIKSLYRFRIDYIMYDKAIEANHFVRGKLKSSDHYPIQVDFYLGNKSNDEN